MFEHTLPKFEFTKLLLDFVTQYAYFLHEIIFNVFVKKFLSGFYFLFEFKHRFKMSSFCLHATSKTLAPLGNSTVDIPMIPIPSTHHAGFIPSALGPPNTTDLNKVDFNMWIVMQVQVYQTPIHDVSDQKQFVWMCGRLLIRGLSIPW